MKPLVSQLWPQFMADPDFAACFGQVIVEHARMLRQDRQVELDRKSTRLNSSHNNQSRMPSSA